LCTAVLWIICRFHGVRRSSRVGSPGNDAVPP
jgi:hypothetical protein